MESLKPAVLNLDLTFGDKEKTLRLLDLLEAEGLVQVNIMRARLDDRSAWMSLELRGPEPRIWEAAAQLQAIASVKDPSSTARSTGSPAA
jgi:hypothetical protein